MTTLAPPGDLAARVAAALRAPEAGPVILTCRAPPPDEVVARLRERLAAIAGRDVELRVAVHPRARVGTTLTLGARERLVIDAATRTLASIEDRLASRGGDEGATLDGAATLLSSLARADAPIRAESLAERGIVREVGDGVAIVTGLAGVGSQEVVQFAGGVQGIAFNLRGDSVGCLLLGPESAVSEGSTVARTGRLLAVPVGDAMLGRVVDALGRPIDGGEPLRPGATRPVEMKSPGIVERQPVFESLHTGIKILDALVPLGRGQRELVLGDRKVGKTTMAVDVILAQRGTGVLCVYAAIGQQATALARTVALLRERGAMPYTVVVAAHPGDPAGLRHVVPYAACTIAESLMTDGRHVLVVYDDLSKHAVTYREISALLERPIGREAYPGDIFYVHSRLLERAARLDDRRGGGSLTAIPVVEMLAGDLSALIPTNVISICDGQVVLDQALFNEGTRPAMDVGLSVSRVGGMAQTPAMRKVAGRLRIDLAQYHEMARFVKFGAEVDEATLRQLARGERELEALKQGPHAPLTLAQEVAILFAAVHGILDPVPAPRVRAFEEALHAHLAAAHAPLMARIADSGDLTSDVEHALEGAITAFRATFLAAEPAHG